MVKHTNPTRPERTACAPYNFVPLPDKLVPAPPLVGHHAYHGDRFSGYLEVTLETLSPTYIRGMTTQAQYQRLAGKGNEDLSPAEKEELAGFFKVTDLPVLPGSSLRGMLRTIVEIITYSRIRWVNETPIFYRAVAVPSSDPLGRAYRSAARNVKAGFLHREGDHWSVKPANFLPVKEEKVKNIPGFLKLKHPNYKPGFFKAYAQIKQNKVSKVTRKSKGNAATEGVLVCSGNMAESGRQTGQRSRRTSHTFVFAADSNASHIPISQQAVEDYLKGLTAFQRKELTAWGGEGCLAEGAPVFYIEEEGEVICFGHSPNFRMPARLNGSGRAARPSDFIPDFLRNTATVDFADALFGWAGEAREAGSQRAGRVFVSDAVLIGDQSGIWYSSAPITPHILASPKPSAFPHYLIQDKEKGHDPDNPSTLAHYGTPISETAIRGFKLYWHKGGNPQIEATAKEREAEKQLTRICPIRAGLHFKFRVYFENLHPAELGALLWAITLPAGTGKQYAYKLGMGKPLGMGAVKLTLDSVVCIDRKQRYAALLHGDGWCLGEQKCDSGRFIREFEEYVLTQLGQAASSQLAGQERIQALLTMLEWPGPDPARTRYMSIEPENEFKTRRVLPTPPGVHLNLCGSSELQPESQRDAVASSPLPRSRPRETTKRVKARLVQAKNGEAVAPSYKSASRRS